MTRPGPVRAVPGIDLSHLARYLPTVLDDYDPAGGLTAALLTGGRSNLTCLLSQGDGRRWVLRRPPLGHVLPTAHDMTREFRALSELAGHDFPAPRPRVLCEDPAVLGVTFMIYEYVPGLIIADEAAARRLSATGAHDLCHHLVHTLARLHAIPPPAVAPGRSSSSAAYLTRQVTRFAAQWHRTRTRDLPDFDRLAGWLEEQATRLAPDYPVTRVHGDYRLDNLVLDPASHQVRAVLDWELSTLGDPVMDLALLLVYWEQPGDGLRRQLEVARGLTTPEGFWSREQLVREYTAATGAPMDHLTFCVALACLKLAVIMESVHYRHLSGEALDELSGGLAAAAPALLGMGLLAADGRGVAGLAG